MKLKKIFSTLLVLILFVSMSASTIQAKPPVSQDRISKMISSISLDKNAKQVISTTSYIKFEKTSSDPNDKAFTSTRHTEAEYLADVKIPDPSNDFMQPNFVEQSQEYGGWMRLTINGYNVGGDNIDLYGFYDWLTVPWFSGKDFITFQHDSNSVFDYNSSYAEIFADIMNPSTGNIFTDYHYKDSTSADFTSQIGGLAYKFSLDPGQMSHSYGMVYTRAMYATPYTPATNIILNYAHDQITIIVTPTIAIPLGSGVRITPASAYDSTPNLGILMQ